jgi:hypothetical protein
MTPSLGPPPRGRPVGSDPVADTPVASLSTIRSPGTAFTRRRVGCVVGLALCAAGLVLLATRQGVPMESDDAVYAGVARTLASGEGLNVPFHYYPLGSVSIGTPPPGSTTPSLTPLVIYARGLYLLRPDRAPGRRVRPGRDR